MTGPITTWWITTGEAGFRTQARGLAQAVAPDAQEKIIGLAAPWSWAPPGLWRLVLAGLDPAKDRLAPPWPDLVVSCGRRAAKVALAVKRASGGRTLAVHIQNPLSGLEAFDLIVAMRHDGVDGSNVMQIDTALHDVTPRVLAEAAEGWRDRFAALPRPLTGVLLGGSTKRRPFTGEQAQALAAQLRTLRAEGGLLITPSRRTPEAVKAVLRDSFGGDPGAYLWDEAGENPYRGILALSDRILVTGDSVSMVSEAVASAHPVAVFPLKAGRRHTRFIDNLAERGIVTRAGAPFAAHPAGAGLNATPAAVQAVRALLGARFAQATTGRSG